MTKKGYFIKLKATHYDEDIKITSICIRLLISETRVTETTGEEGRNEQVHWNKRNRQACTGGQVPDRTRGQKIWLGLTYPLIT